MPITLNYKIIDQQEFAQALVVLKDYPFRNQRFAYNVAKIWRRLDAEFQVANGLWQKLIRQFAEVDEKGKLVPRSPEEPNTFKIPEDKTADFEAAKKSFTSIEFEIDCHPLKLEQLETMPISAGQIEALSALFDFTEDSPAKAD